MLHVRLGLALLCTVSSALRTPPVLPKTTPPAAATQLEHKTVFSSPGWAARQQASRAPIIKARSSAARAPALRVQGGRGSAHSGNVFGQLARDAAASSVTAVSKMVRNYKGDEEETSAAQDVEIAVDSAVKGGANIMLVGDDDKDEGLLDEYEGVGFIQKETDALTHARVFTCVLMPSIWIRCSAWWCS